MTDARPDQMAEAPVHERTAPPHRSSLWLAFSYALADPNEAYLVPPDPRG